MKKLQITRLSLFLCAINFAITSASQAVNLPPALKSSVPLPAIEAKSWVLLESETQWIIAEENSDLRI